VCCGFDRVNSLSPPKNSVFTEPSVDASSAGVTIAPLDVSVCAVTVLDTVIDPAFTCPVVVMAAEEVIAVVESGCVIETSSLATVRTAVPRASAKMMEPSVDAGV